MPHLEDSPISSQIRRVPASCFRQPSEKLERGTDTPLRLRGSEIGLPATSLEVENSLDSANSRLILLARPERFELPTTWLVAREDAVSTSFLAF